MINEEEVQVNEEVPETTPEVEQEQQQEKSVPDEIQPPPQ
jgi:hypothetical protein